jgi:hypothetical protein
MWLRVAWQVRMRHRTYRRAHAGTPRVVLVAVWWLASRVVVENSREVRCAVRPQPGERHGGQRSGSGRSKLDRPGSRSRIHCHSASQIQPNPDPDPWPGRDRSRLRWRERREAAECATVRRRMGWLWGSSATGRGPPTRLVCRQSSRWPYALELGAARATAMLRLLWTVRVTDGHRWR